ncbi:HipA-like N-terminal domain family [Verrucomicrobiia bacterium DG1235]|nr:HipA-like N-terminal domain family [Verrucomicrobiae bacterium DG1235]
MAASLADVFYHGKKAGVVFWDGARRVAVFEYTPDFIKNGVELAPLKMPLRAGPFQFPDLHESYSGLPGLLADCLPDVYGNTLIDAWLRQQGRRPADFSPVERLCYIGNRGMGALEFRPGLREKASKPERLEIDKLVELASRALSQKDSLSTGFAAVEDMREILRVGTSAGGARAKAVIALNPKTMEVRSGQADVGKGFEHWLLKFDGVTESFDGVRDPQGYGRIEYAYHRMARAAGIDMSECRLLEEGGRAHFMTRRFDRPDCGGKLHCASLFGIAHMQYSAPGSHSHSYEDYFEVIEELDLPPSSKLEAFRRMVFNVFGCNRDDHAKNFGFVLENSGQWKLSPAFDVTYSFNPQPGKWTAMQQMSIMGKREGITREDLLAIGRQCDVATLPKLKSAIEGVIAAVQRWEVFAEQAKVGDKETAKVRAAIARDK